MRTHRFRLMTVLVLFWAIVSLSISGVLYQPVLNQRFAPSIAFALFIIISFIGAGALGIGLILLVIRLEHVQSPRTFFRIERLDSKGIWLATGLVLAFDIASASFLRQVLFLPISNYLETLGIEAGFIGINGSIVPSLTPLAAVFVTAFLLIFFWIEIPSLSSYLSCEDVLHPHE